MKKIDLTQDALRKQIREHEGKYYQETMDVIECNPFTDLPMEHVETTLHCIEGIGLIAELKRCYELIDRLQMHVDPAWKTYDKQVNAKYSNNEASE
jgi:hypothetical protein